MYNGGISYSGDRAKAKSALPEALKLANLVRALKTSAGLDRYEKTFDIEGGIVRVVDFEHVRHLYIDVSPPSEEEPEERETIEALEQSTYACFPVWEDPWTYAPSAAYEDAVGVTAIGGGGAFAVAEQAFLEDVHSYHTDLIGERRFWSALGWRGQNNIYLYCRQHTLTNRYSMGWGERGEEKLRHRSHEIVTLSPFSYSHFIGFGIFGSKLIYMTCVCTNFTQEATPTAAFESVVTVRSVDVTYNPDTLTLSPQAGTDVLVGTFSQDRTEYGLSADGGFTDRPSHQTDQAGLWYDIPGYDPERAYSPKHGSLWFNFSPDGSKCVRCRGFANATANGFTNHAFKEEISFSLDVDGDVQMSRVITSTAAHTLTRTTVTDTAYNNDVLAAPLGNDQPDTDSGLKDNGYTKSERTEVSLTDLPIAYDYDEGGNLVELHFRFNTALATWDESYSFYEAVDYTYTQYTSGGYLHFERDGTGTGNMSHSWSQSSAISTELVYITPAGTVVIPYYTGNYSSSDSESATWTHTSFAEDSHFPGDTGSSWFTRTGSGTRTQSGSYDTNFFVVHQGSGISEMDLRTGVFVVSLADLDAIWSGSGSNPDPDDAPTIDKTSSTHSVTGDRTDTLYVVRDGVLTATPLSQAAVDDPISFSLSESGSYLMDIPMLGGGFSSDHGRGWLTLLAGVPFFGLYRSRSVYADANFPIKSSIWAWGVVRGAGGSLAYNRTRGADELLLTVFGSDFDWSRGNALTWSDVEGSSSQSGLVSGELLPVLNRFPICQQLIYYYDVLNDRLVGVNPAMWRSNQFSINGSTWDTKDTGVGQWHQEYDDRGLVNQIHYADSGESL